MIAVEVLFQFLKRCETEGPRAAPREFREWMKEQ